MNNPYEFNSRCKHYREELRYNGASDTADGVEATNVVVAGESAWDSARTSYVVGEVGVCGSKNSTLSR